MASPVRFVEQITAMIDAGVRVFVEVGPGRILSGLIEKIVLSLGLNEAIHILPCAPDRGNTQEFLSTLLHLSWLGYKIDWGCLWHHRSCQLLDVDHLSVAQQPKLLWWIDGMRAWPDQGPMPSNYLNPLNQIVDPVDQTQSKPHSSDHHQFDSWAYLHNSERLNTNRPNQHTAEEVQVSHDSKLTNNASQHLEHTDAMAHAAKAYFESMKNLAQAQERVMLALLGQDVQSSTTSKQAPYSMTQVTSDLMKVESSNKTNEVIDFWGSTSTSTNTHHSPQIINNNAMNLTGEQILENRQPKLELPNEKFQYIDPQSQEAPTDDAKVIEISIQEALIDLVSERTGYPAEMLSLDLDLEADLSIDSIKRIEILGP